jgi:dTMP kinase
MYLSMARGKLIAFEGTDGSGKGTQLKLLVEILKSKSIPFETLDYPRYEQSFFGALAGKMLKGDFGGLDIIPPELAVLPFACDRWLQKNDIIRWLNEGNMVISNRYTASSAVYHAAKMPPEKQQQFAAWVYTMEQDVIGLPREDLVLYFHVPVAVAQALVTKKESRAYLGDRKKDIYEESTPLQEMVEKLYLQLAVTRSNWKTIECVKAGAIRTPEEILKDVLDVLTVNRIL